MSKSAICDSLARSYQSCWLWAAIIDPMSTLLGKSFMSSFAPYTQYFALFSEMSSMFEKEGSLLRMSVVPLKILGATF